MAVRQIGTVSTARTLNAIQYSQNPNDTSAYSGGSADLPALVTTIKDDLNPLSNSPNKFFDYNGLLFIPRRGQLRVLPGDFVCVDPATGWVFLLSAGSAASASWSHT